MKREYTKPQVIVEDYCLSESVATCEEITVSQYNNNININQAWEILTDPNGFFKLFNAGSCASDASQADSSVFAGLGVCYHTSVSPSNGGTFHFNS